MLQVPFPLDSLTDRDSCMFAMDAVIDGYSIHDSMIALRPRSRQGMRCNRNAVFGLRCHWQKMLDGVARVGVLLLRGPSGCGKSLSIELVAQELGTRLLPLDPWPKSADVEWLKWKTRLTTRSQDPKDRYTLVIDPLETAVASQHGRTLLSRLHKWLRSNAPMIPVVVVYGGTTAKTVDAWSQCAAETFRYEAPSEPDVLCMLQSARVKFPRERVAKWFADSRGDLNQFFQRLQSDSSPSLAPSMLATKSDRTDAVCDHLYSLAERCLSAPDRSSAQDVGDSILLHATAERQVMLSLLRGRYLHQTGRPMAAQEQLANWWSQQDTLKSPEFSADLTPVDWECVGSLNQVLCANARLAGDATEPMDLRFTSVQDPSRRSLGQNKKNKKKSAASEQMYSRANRHWQTLNRSARVDLLQFQAHIDDMTRVETDPQAVQVDKDGASDKQKTNKKRSRKKGQGQVQQHASSTTVVEHGPPPQHVSDHLGR